MLDLEREDKKDRKNNSNVFIFWALFLFPHFLPLNFCQGCRIPPASCSAKGRCFVDAQHFSKQAICDLALFFWSIYHDGSFWGRNINSHFGEEIYVLRKINLLGLMTCPVLVKVLKKKKQFEAKMQEWFSLGYLFIFVRFGKFEMFFIHFHLVISSSFCNFFLGGENVIQKMHFFVKQSKLSHLTSEDNDL